MKLSILWDPWTISAAAAIAVVSVAVASAPGETASQPIAPAATDGQISFVLYRAIRQDWSEEPATWCNIGRRFALTGDQLEATLFLNGSGGRCANALSTAPANRAVKIALGSREQGSCLAEVFRCPVSDQMAPPGPESR